MKHVISSAILVCLLFATTGCDEVTPDDVQGITKGVVSLGMRTWASKNPTKAAEVAKQAVISCDNALNYLDNSQGIATTVLDAVVQAKLTKGLPEEIQALIESAATILDKFLPEPAPDKYLTPEQLAYMKAFVSGVRDAMLGIGTRDLEPIKDLKKIEKYQAKMQGKPHKWLNKPKEVKAEVVPIPAK